MPDDDRNTRYEANHLKRTLDRIHGRRNRELVEQYVDGRRGKCTLRTVRNYADALRKLGAEVGRILRGLREHAGIERHLTPKSFRHNEATRLVKEGWSQEMIDKKLWTPGSKMAAVYVHLDRSDLAAQVRKDAGIEEYARSVGGAMKEGPTCADPVKAAARKCKHCGELIEGSAEGARRLEAMSG